MDFAASLDSSPRSKGELSTPTSVASAIDQPAGMPGKKGRGRPRKYPKPRPLGAGVPARSRTGCLTCRVVKKKCDELRPICGRCRVNRVECVSPMKPPTDAELEADTDEPSREASDENNEPSSKLASQLDDEDLSKESFRELGVGLDAVDKFLWLHLENTLTRCFGHVQYSDSLGCSLLEMACSGSPASEGLWHSLLWLAGVHISVSSCAPLPDIENRMMQHYGYAISSLREKLNVHGTQDASSGVKLDDQSVALTLVLGLDSLLKGQADANYTSHLDGLRVILESMSADWPHTKFRRCVVDFYIYHKASHDFTSLSQRPLPQRSFFDFLDSSTLAGSLKYMLINFFRVSKLRRQVRRRRQQQTTPLLDHDMLAEADSIEDALRTWDPPDAFPEPQSLIFSATRECALAYLFRTISPPAMPTPKLKAAVDAGIAFMREMHRADAPNGRSLLAVFMLGVASFEDEQRNAVSALFDAAQRVRTPAAIGRAADILHCVWRLMDQGSDESWDWESVIKNRMGLDFLLA